jgi:hypothetical protein
MQAVNFMRHYLLTLLLLLSGTLVFGQKEVFFEPIDSANMKVRSFQGIEVSLLPYKTINVPFRFDRYSLSGYVGYYYEKAVAPTWTVRLTAGMHTVYGANYRLIPDNSGQTGYYYSQTVYNTYQIYQVGVEPRWNYSFKKRYTAGKATLNSGWFLSLPISMEMTYNKNYSLGNLYGIDPQRYIQTLHVLPTLGFRSAISQHFYWEGSAGVGGYVGLNKYTFRDFKPKLDYSLKLSVGYAF